MDEYMKGPDVQQYLNIGRKRYYELVHRPDFPAVRFGKNIRVNRAALEQWAAEQRMI